MKVIFDTNIWITMLMGFQVSFFKHVFKNVDIDIYVCDDLIKEVMSVSFRDKFENRITDASRERLNILFTKACKHTLITASSRVPIRDPKDLYLLSLSETIAADYLVSGDKDLLVLRHHDATEIISLAEFKKIIEATTR